MSLNVCSNSSDGAMKDWFSRLLTIPTKVGQQLHYQGQRFFQFLELEVYPTQSSFTKRVHPADQQTHQRAWVENLRLPDWLNDAAYDLTTKDLARYLNSLGATGEGVNEYAFERPSDREALSHHQSCHDCIDFHGQSYGGNFLVCAIHPYGVEAETECPDKRLSGI